MEATGKFHNQKMIDAKHGGTSEIAVSGGLARIAIRSTGETGDFKVIAKGKGLKDVELTVKSL